LILKINNLIYKIIWWLIILFSILKFMTLFSYVHISYCLIIFQSYTKINLNHNNLNLLCVNKYCTNNSKNQEKIAIRWRFTNYPASLCSRKEVQKVDQWFASRFQSGLIRRGISSRSLLSRASLVKGASFSPIVKSGRIVGSYSTGRDPKPVLPDQRTLGDCVRDVGEVMVRRSEAKTLK